MKDFLSALVSIGVTTTDDNSIVLRKQFMNAMALLMSVGGIVWGTISLFFNAYLPASIPYSYAIFTCVNLFFFSKTHNFGRYRLIQVIMSLMLPFLFQWSLGGLIESGGMMLWSFLALVGSMSVQDVKKTIPWLVFYILLVVVSGVIDPLFLRFSLGIPNNIKVWFFVLNIGFISAVIFMLMRYYLQSRNESNQALTELTRTLEEKVQIRTADLTQMNGKLINLNDELQTTLEQVSEKNEIILHKNKNITDSLNYAKRIQKALLQRNDSTCVKMKDYFVFFKPKELVSGDIYWFHCANDSSFIAVAVDCTGHGVPGAFMSLIADSLLNHIVVDNGIVEPAQILTEMDKGIERAMHSDESHQRDGMDMSVIRIEKNSSVVTFAGAKMPVYAVQNGIAEYIKGSPFSIGGGLARLKKVFESHTVSLQSGSMVYLFTDGFPDQLGGKDGSKYLIKNFRMFLQSISHLSGNDQRQLIYDEYNSWKGKFAQTDDMLVLGFRV